MRSCGNVAVECGLMNSGSRRMNDDQTNEDVPLDGGRSAAARVWRMLSAGSRASYGGGDGRDSFLGE